MHRLCLLMMLLAHPALAQLPVEAFAGHERTTADVLWFRYFKNTSEENSRFLFFNRSRASVDYHNKTAFGLTSAVSYNFTSGIGIVAVAQFLNTGFYPKAGIQFFTRKKTFTLFTWLVTETRSDPSLDFFILSRYEPALTEKLTLFSQAELVNTTDRHGYYQFIQRIRLGVGFRQAWQTGFGADLQQAGKKTFATAQNLGVFIRKEF
jgi:hypothetical protein